MAGKLNEIVVEGHGPKPVVRSGVLDMLFDLSPISHIYLHGCTHVQELMTCPLEKLRIVIGPDLVFPLKDHQVESMRKFRAGNTYDGPVCIIDLFATHPHHPRFVGMDLIGACVCVCVCVCVCMCV